MLFLKLGQPSHFKLKKKKGTKQRDHESRKCFPPFIVRLKQPDLRVALCRFTKVFHGFTNFFFFFQNKEMLFQIFQPISAF